MVTYDITIEDGEGVPIRVSLEATITGDEIANKAKEIVELWYAIKQELKKKIESEKDILPKRGKDGLYG